LNKLNVATEKMWGIKFK